MRLAAAVLAGLLVLTGCSGGGNETDPLASPDSASPDPQVLPAGKSDLPLAAGTFYSPVDFVPPLAITVPDAGK